MNYYEMLEVSRDASEEVIRAAYKAQTAKYHPDNVISGDESKMKEINLAYETLSDPVLRAEYDKKLENEEKKLWKMIMYGNNRMNRKSGIKPNKM